MYDNDKTVRMLALYPNGTLREVICEPDRSLEAMRQVIGCSAVEVISLPNKVDLWLDDEALIVDEPVANLFAAAVLSAMAPEWAGQMVFGTAMLAGVRGAKTVSLDPSSCNLIIGLVAVLGGRMIPTMRSVSMDGGRAWEWVHQGVHFRAESHNGSPVVKLRFRTDAPDSVWTDSTERGTDGRSASYVAEEIYRDTTGGVL